MIKAIGDSHALYMFRKMPGVFAWPLGPVTLKRVGYLEDTIVQDNVSRIGAASDDMFLFCFGEIDVRAYVKPWHERTKDKMTLNAMLADWAHRYAEALAALDLKGARIGIVSVVPPASAKRSRSAKLPVAGSDKERAEYARVLNLHLAVECEARGWPYVDIHALYADAAGMLPASRSTTGVHVKGNAPIRSLLVDMRLLER